MIVLGLCGKAGAGKNATSELLCRMFNLIEMAFADPLYEAVSAITRMTPAELKHRDNKERAIKWLGGKSPRYLLQTLGTEWGRRLVSDDVWIEIAKRRIRGMGSAAVNGVVLTDVRFDNEAAAIHSLGGVVWEITRAGASALDRQAAAHESERGVSPFLIGYTLENNGSLADLHANAAAAFRGQFHAGKGVRAG